MKTIGIIGGGPAGLMAAATLLENQVNAKIFLIEKNAALGGKLLQTGGGRCNLTTSLQKEKEILTHYTRGKEFIKYALREFPPRRVCTWFLAHGLATKNEADNKVYPLSNQAQDVLNVFINFFKKYSNIKILLNTDVDEKFLGEHKFDYLIMATGGINSKKLLSTLKHKITPLAPALTSFETKETWSKELSGLSLNNCRIIFNATHLDGHFLFTHYGISGPVVLSLSSILAYQELTLKKPCLIKLRIDAEKDFTKWDKILTDKFNFQGAQTIKNSLSELVPKKLAPQILALAKINPEIKVAKISKLQRQALAKLLGGGLELHLTKRRTGQEMVTAGGVELTQIDPRTCQSKINPRLFFCGEVLNVDAVTGGFNLQNCWMTGRLVGQAFTNIKSLLE